jgi:hypothetical protein
MTIRDPRGYFAVSRGIFDHPLLQTSKPYTLREALLWLICRAAWKPKAERNKFGSVHTKRGQITATRRQLAAEWNWSKSKVDRFLKKLSSDSTVALGEALNGPEIRPETAPIIGYPKTMITLCNYDKFQSLPRGYLNQKAGQKAGQNGPELPGISDGEPLQPVKPSTKERKRRPDSCPADGASNGRVIFARLGTDLWNLYAEDYRNTTGAEMLPERYPDGNAGRWFNRSGANKTASK